MIASAAKRPLAPGQQSVLDQHLRACEPCRTRAANASTQQVGSRPRHAMATVVAPGAPPIGAAPTAAMQNDHAAWSALSRIPEQALAALPTAPAPGSVPGAAGLAPTLQGAPGVPSTADSAYDLPQLPVIDPRVYVRGPVFGQGGMGQVVRARDRRLGRTVAIKELLADQLRQRFEQEARLTARLQHPSIVNVHEAGCWPSGEPFYAMKLVAGRSLEEVIADTRPFRDRLALLQTVISVSDALAYAHSQRIIHRDLKPANILVGSFGETVVIDWGLAKDLSTADTSGEEAMGPYRSAGDGLTVFGAGTPQYMPPEQAAGETPDERVDVYAIGATLYHLLTGTPPYGMLPAQQVLRKLRLGPPVNAGDIESEIPQQLQSIVAKAMARDPADRYATAGELAEDLKRFQSGQLVGVHQYSVSDLVRRWIRRHRGAFAVGVLAAVAVAVLMVLGLREVARERTRHSRARLAAAEMERNFLLQQARAELDSGRPDRALAMLVALYERAPSDPAVQLLLPRAAAAARDDGDPEPVDLGIDAAHLVASATGDRVAALDVTRSTAVIWDAVHHRILATFEGIDSGTIAFAPDGASLIAGRRGALERLDLDGTPIARIPNAEDPTAGQFDAAAFSPDGRFVALTPTLVVRSAHDLSAAFTPQRRASAAAFSPDSTILAVGTPSGALFAHDTRTWEELAGRLGDAPIGSIAFSDGGSLVLVARPSEATIELWDAATWTRSGTRPGLVVHSSADGSAFAVLTSAGVDIYDAASREVTRRVSSAAPIVEAHLDAAGNVVAVRDADGNVRIVRVATGETLYAAPLSGYSSLAAPPGGARAFAARDGLLVSVRLTDLVHVGQWPRDQAFGPVVASAAPVVALADTDRRVRVARADSGLSTAIDAPAPIAAVALSSAGDRVGAALADGSLIAWNASTGEVVGHAPPASSGAVAVAFCRDSERMWSVRADGAAAVWDVGPSAPRVVPAPQIGAVSAATLVCGASGSLIMARGAEVGVWDARAATQTDYVHVEGPVQIAADGGAFVTSFAPGGVDIHRWQWFEVRDGLIRERRLGKDMPWPVPVVALRKGRPHAVMPDGRLLNMVSGKYLGSRATAASAPAVAFSPDGAVLATADATEVALWDPRTGTTLLVIGAPDPVRTLWFTAAGERVVGVGDRTVTIWSVPRETGPPAQVAPAHLLATPWRYTGDGRVQRTNEEN